MKSSSSCRRCRRWLEGEWNVAETDETRERLQRQMNQGYCNICLPAAAAEADLRPVVADMANYLAGQEITDPIGYLETLLLTLQVLAERQSTDESLGKSAQRAVLFTGPYGIGKTTPTERIDRHAAADFLARLHAQLDEDEERATPRTVIHSGGAPAPVIPNCIGPSGTGDCAIQWRIDPTTIPQDQWKELEREHELSHATPQQRRALADVEAKRYIVALHEKRNGYCNCCGGGWPCLTLQYLAKERP